MQALEIVHKFHQNVEIVLFGIHPQPAGLYSRHPYEHNPSQDRLVREIYNGSSIFVCASWHEGFGFPGAEAMACGCTLATTDTGFSRDCAEHAVTSLMAEPRKPELLAENIIRLLDDDALRIRLARAGHERIRQFTWERSAARMERLIQYELASRRRPSSAI